jgi:hypothetical protein
MGNTQCAALNLRAESSWGATIWETEKEDSINSAECLNSAISYFGNYALSQPIILKVFVIFKYSLRNYVIVSVNVYLELVKHLHQRHCE